jgi:hypothetical protein
MHNIDRTQAEAWEMSPEFDEMQEFEYGSGEFEFESDQETYGEAYGAYGEMEFESPLSEADEMELAAELLEVSSEEELDQFIGKLFKKVSGGLRKAFRSPVFKSLGGMLKGVAKKALPMAGGALGTLIPIPGVGTALGTAAGKAAGQMFGLELEGMSAEDQEFEVARRVVRLGAEAAKQAADAPPNAPPQPAAKQALVNAAQTHAPGLVGASGPTGGPSNGQRPQRRRLPRSGRWMRQGRNIVLLNIY